MSGHELVKNDQLGFKAEHHWRRMQLDLLTWIQLKKKIGNIIYKMPSDCFKIYPYLVFQCLNKTRQIFWIEHLGHLMTPFLTTMMRNSNSLEVWKLRKVVFSMYNILKKNFNSNWIFWTDRHVMPFSCEPCDVGEHSLGQGLPDDIGVVGARLNGDRVALAELHLKIKSAETLDLIL